MMALQTCFEEEESMMALQACSEEEEPMMALQTCFKEEKKKKLRWPYKLVSKKKNL